MSKSFVNTGVAKSIVPVLIFPAGSVQDKVATNGCVPFAVTVWVNVFPFSKVFSLIMVLLPFSVM